MARGSVRDIDGQTTKDKRNRRKQYKQQQKIKPLKTQNVKKDQGKDKHAEKHKCNREMEI